MLSVTRASVDPADPTSIKKTFVDIIWYNLFATNDAIRRLGGSPFSNQSPFRWYSGSSNDLRLNLQIPRYQASPVALASINAGFQTSGVLRRPLVSLHTTGDPIIPYWHAALFQMKVLMKGSALQYVHMPVLRYGHCNFKVYEVLAGFAVLVLKVSGQDLLVTPAALPNAQEQQPLRDLAGKHGARPKIVERGAAD